MIYFRLFLKRGQVKSLSSSRCQYSFNICLHCFQLNGEKIHVQVVEFPCLLFLDSEFFLNVFIARAWFSVFGRAHRGSTIGLLLLQRFRVGLLLRVLVLSFIRVILIYMFAVLIHWWVEVLHAKRTTSMCIWTTAEPRMRLLQRKTGLCSPPPSNLLLTVPRRCFCCGSFYLLI